METFEVSIVVRSREQLRELYTAGLERMEGLLKAVEGHQKKRWPTGDLEQLLELWDGHLGWPGLMLQLKDEMLRYKLLTEEEEKQARRRSDPREQTRDLFAEVPKQEPVTAEAEAEEDQEASGAADYEPATSAEAEAEEDAPAGIGAVFAELDAPPAAPSIDELREIRLRDVRAAYYALYLEEMEPPVPGSDPEFDLAAKLLARRLDILDRFNEEHGTHELHPEDRVLIDSAAEFLSFWEIDAGDADVGGPGTGMRADTFVLLEDMKTLRAELDHWLVGSRLKPEETAEFRRAALSVVSGEPPAEDLTQIGHLAVEWVRERAEIYRVPSTKIFQDGVRQEIPEPVSLPELRKRLAQREAAAAPPAEAEESTEPAGWDEGPLYGVVPPVDRGAYLVFVGQKLPRISSPAFERAAEELAEVESWDRYRDWCFNHGVRAMKRDWERVLEIHAASGSAIAAAASAD